MGGLPATSSRASHESNPATELAGCDETLRYAALALVQLRGC
jgi:hypothetical protein